MVLDIDCLLESLDGDRSLALDVIEVFLETFPPMVSELRDAIAAGAPDGVERAAHSLKGAVGYLGAPTVSEVALQLEQLGRQGDLTGADMALATLEERLVALRTDLQEFCALVAA